MTESSSPVRILAEQGTARRIGRELSRRGFMSAALAAGVTGFLAACSTGGGAGAGGSAAPMATGGKLENALSMYSWGDYDNPDVLKAFQKDIGPKLTVSSFGSNEEMIAKLVAAKGTAGYDLVVPTGTYIPQMAKNGLLQQLNHDLIPNLKNMDPAFLARAWDPKNQYSICKDWGTTGFVYDTTVIKRELKTWADFLDAAQKEASGKTAVLDDPKDILGIYFWANGIDWNTTKTSELDAAEKYLVDSLASHISAFDSNPGTGAIPQGTHALIQVWNGDARNGILNSKTPDRWKWVLGAPDTEIWMDNWAIAAGAPHPNAAHAFINYVLDPKVSLDELSYIGYPTGVKGVDDAAKAAKLDMLDLVFFDEAQLKTMHTGEVNEAEQRTVDIYNKMKAAAGA